MDPTIDKIGVREDQKYKYSVSDSIVEVIFADDKTVVLETESGHRRYEDTDQFEKGIGNQWERVKSTTEDQTPERNNQTSNVDAESEEDTDKTKTNYTTLEIIQSTVELLKEKFEHDEQDVTGQKAEAINQLHDLLPASELEEIDFDDVNGVGEGTAQNLRERGIVYKIHLEAAREEYIKDTNGIGSKSYQSLMEQAPMNNT